MPRHVIHRLPLRTVCISSALLAVAACERPANTVEPDARETVAESAGELSWARAALERNPQIEVLASDPQSGVFTVRDRRSGEVQAVATAELAAVPVAQLAQATRMGDVASQESASTDATREGATDPLPAQARAPARRTAEASAESVSEQPPTGTNYTIERSNGQLRVSGPGVSIVSSGGGTAAPGGAAEQGGGEPIICEGRRMVHLDNRTLRVEGDAITARGGCELYITNSRIVASGTGLVVEDAAVHISNSHIEGAQAAFEAADSSRLFVRGSTFQGVPRRTELATIQDQGGNRWR